MKREYDFSKAEQGKFYRKGAVIQLPIYLDAKVQAQVERVARKCSGFLKPLHVTAPDE